jgi:hypothetical protein
MKLPIGATEEDFGRGSPRVHQCIPKYAMSEPYRGRSRAYFASSKAFSSFL